METSFTIADSKLQFSREFTSFLSRSPPYKAVVSILGFQSTGKSTLLNQILQNNIFEVEVHKHLSMHRTTQGLVGFDTENSLFIDSEGFSSVARDDRLNLFDNSIMEISSILPSILIVMINYNDHTSESGFIKSYLRTLFRRILKKEEIRKQKLIIAVCNTKQHMKIAIDVKNKVYSEWSSAIKDVKGGENRIFDTYFEVETEFLLFDHENDQYYEEYVSSLRNMIETETENYKRNIGEIANEIENYRAEIENLVSENYEFLLDFVKESLQKHEEKCEKILQNMEKILNNAIYFEKYEEALYKTLSKLEFILPENSFNHAEELRDQIRNECERLKSQYEKGTIIIKYYIEGCFEKLNTDFKYFNNLQEFTQEIRNELPLLIQDLDEVVKISLHSLIESKIESIQKHSSNLRNEYELGFFELKTLIDTLNLSFNTNMESVYEYLEISSQTQEVFEDFCIHFTSSVKSQLNHEFQKQLRKLREECELKLEQYAIADNELLRFKIDLLKIKFSWFDIYHTTPKVDEFEQELNHFISRNITSDLVKREIHQKKNFYKTQIVAKIDKAQVFEYVKAGLLVGTSVVGGFAIGAAVRAAQLTALGTEAAIVGVATSVAIGTGIGSGALGLATLLLSLENLENMSWSHSAIVEEDGWFERIEEIGGRERRTKIIKKELIEYIRNTEKRPMNLMDEIDREYRLKEYDIEKKIDQVLRDYNASN